MTTPTAPGLADRYGAPNPVTRRLVVVLVVVLAVAGLTWTLWTAWVHAHPQVTSALVTSRIMGPHGVEATFTVVRASGDVRATCVLQAVAVDHSVVGERVVRVGPGGPTTTTLRRALRTDRTATSVDLVGCRAPGQDQAE